MSRVLYLDATFGLSGDMLLAALSCEVDLPRIVSELKSLPIETWQAEITTVTRCGISARQVRFSGGHSTRHRHLAEIIEMFDRSGWPSEIILTATNIFRVLAKAEGEVHGVLPEKVHFHEVGAVDSILDIAGFAWAYHLAGGPRMYVSTLPFMEGVVTTEHGIMSVPTPATASLLQGFKFSHMAGVPRGEAITPTGAAILVGTATEQVWPGGTVLAVGYGAGQRDPKDYPNVLRAVWLEQEDRSEAEEVILIEATIDDMDSRLYPVVVEKLLDNGALDASIYAGVMKKGRPGHLLRVMIRPQDLLKAAEVIFTETTTIGISYERRRRLTLKRSFITIDIDGVSVKVKTAKTPGGSTNYSPEYGDCVTAAKVLNRSVKDIILEAGSKALVQGE